MNKIFLTLIVSLLSTWSALAYGSEQLCKSASLSSLRETAQTHRLENIVFFASWCSSCRDHIEEARLDKTAFIIAFDDPSRAEKALGSLLRSQGRHTELVFCFSDPHETIRGNFQVNHLPFKTQF